MTTPEQNPDVEEASGLESLIPHLIELKQRLTLCVVFFFAAFTLSYYFSENIFQFLVDPLAKILADQQGRRLIYTGLTEAFVTYLKVAFFAASFLTFPLAAIQIWKFVAPGLYSNEKMLFRPLLFATPALFFLGAAFSYYIILPNAWAFFLSFETAGAAGQMPIQLEARVHEYLSLVMQLVFAFGLSFQLPLVLILLSRIGVLSVSALTQNRKYAFLFIMIGSAFLTPPDVMSMIGLALPVYGLYELSILAVKYMIRADEKKNEGVPEC